MWFWSKKRLTDTKALGDGSVDWHCHILPGVDDGIESMEKAIRVLAHYEHLGMDEVWLTPHIMEDVPNTTDGLRRRFDELQECYAKGDDSLGCTGSIKLHLASENMIDNLFNKRLAAKDFLPMGERGDHLLVETSYFQPPIKLWETLQSILDAGYFPVIAHPERYRYMEDEEYERLVEMKTRLQLNMTSLAGAYGDTVQEKALDLLKEGRYTLMGTDLHHLTPFKRAEERKCLKKRVVELIANIPNKI